jgi:DNA-binding transcriptional MerR regulator
MSWSCTTVNREFSPGEAAEITGVSTALQRDWRRRKILPESNDGKWTRWDLADIIRLSVMKLFSDAGMDVSKTGTVAQMAMMPTLSALYALDGAVEVENDANVPAGEVASIIERMAPRTSHRAHSIGRFLVVTGPNEFDVCRVSDVSAVSALMDEQHRPIVSIVDCQTLAALIVERAGGPVIRFEIAASEEGEAQ